MNTLSRKQREIAERHALFLDVARNLLFEEGLHQLSMDRVAELSEYSKGTVYQHFSCKEDMLLGVCCQAMTGLAELFDRAIATARQPSRSHGGRGFRTRDVVSPGAAQSGCQAACRDEQPARQGQRREPGPARHAGEPADRHAASTSCSPPSRITNSPTVTDIDPLSIVFGLHAMSFGGIMLQSHASCHVRRGGVEAPRAAFAGFDLMRLLNALLDGFRLAATVRPGSP